jgi:hypothetical protein
VARSTPLSTPHRDEPTHAHPHWRLMLAAVLIVAGLVLDAILSPAAAAANAAAQRGTVAYCKQHAAGVAERTCIVRVVFAPYGMSRKAVRVANCESTFRPWAVNGQYRGMFQVSKAWRRDVKGFGPSAEEQARHALGVVLHRDGGWGHWQCQ